MFQRYRLRIPRPILTEMLAQARREFPAECCGLLAGRVEPTGSQAEVIAHYPLVNSLQSPTEFISEPRSMFAAMKDMRARGIDVVCVYHSHPTAEPIPSRRDLERNYSEQVMNLIIGMLATDLDVRAWWLSSQSYEAGEWEVEG